MASKQSKKRAKSPAKTGSDFQLMKYKSRWVVGAIARFLDCLEAIQTCVRWIGLMSLKNFRTAAKKQ